jgi:ribosomal protein S18 acetylase RimI-like enzyme
MTARRPATAADRPAMAAVFVAAWRGGYRGIVPDDVIDAWTVERALQELDGSDDIDIVTDEVDGFVRFRPGYIASLYVDPAAGGRGIGTALLRHALADIGSRPVTLWVFEANVRARALYERNGFRPDGARIVDPRWRVPQIRLLHCHI